MGKDIFYIIKNNKKCYKIVNTYNRCIVLTFVFIMLLMFLLQAFYIGLTTIYYQVSSHKITADVRLLTISDLHSCRFGKSQSDLLNAIDKVSPDVVFLTGDIIDDYLPCEPAIELLELLARQYDCYYITGNHEIWTDKADEIKNMIANYGISVLDGKCKEVVVNGQKLNICGIDDPDYGYEANQLEKAFKNIDTDAYTILLAHRPERGFIYEQYPCDLVISGHAHGGQWRLPGIIEGMYAPDQGFFPKCAGGVFQYKKYTHVISRGLALNYTTPRIFNPPELTVIELSPGNE